MYQRKYGPFTPQELNSMLIWLEAKNITFEIIKDDQAEKQITDNSPSNMLSLAEFRTDAYLAQIFYIEIAFPDMALINLFQQNFIPSHESIPDWVNHIKDVATKPLVLNQSNRKAFWARAIVLYLVLSSIIAYFLNRKS